MLGPDFRHRGWVSKAVRARRVRTPKGAKFFGQPIGSIITPDVLSAAEKVHGKGLAHRMMITERDAKVPLPQNVGVEQLDIHQVRRKYEQEQKRKAKARRKKNPLNVTPVPPGQNQYGPHGPTQN